MSIQTYRPRPGPEALPKQTEVAAPALPQALPSEADLGSRVDLPEAIRSKMEASFGADFSGVQLYESQAVAGAGAEAVASGSRIAFAPGKLDLASTAGQVLLGHELSHVASQARGEVTGSGFLNDHALEARADREGALAAAGESVAQAPAAPLSASSVASAAGPMQARKANSKEKMTKDGFDLHSGAHKGGTAVDSDSFLFTSIFGSSEDRTTTKVEPAREMRQYNIKKGLPMTGDQGASVTADAFGGADNDRIKGHIYKPPQGTGNGKRVILYSGSAGSNQDQMTGNVQQYLDAGFTVYAYDYGGFGKSKTVDGKLSEASMQEDAQQIYDHVLSDGGKASDTLLHGFSMGGPMASHVARNAAIKAAKSGKEDDKLGGLVLESSMKDVTNAANAGSPVAGTIGGKIGSMAHGDFDAQANLKELAALDPEIPVTFISGDYEDKVYYDDPEHPNGIYNNDQLSETHTKLFESTGGLFRNAQNQTLENKHHMSPDKLSQSWEAVKGKLMRNFPGIR